ncbi:MAG: hypothetical protein WEB60_14745 [Terrimicrobiaceae bacterium]
MENEESISKLLRLKRYEQPPQGYHEAFLRDFHRRQRAGLLKRSPWQNLWDSVSDIWPNFQVPKLAYATMAVAAIAAAGYLVNPPSSSENLLASAPVPHTSIGELNVLPDFSLEPQRPATIGSTLPVSGRGDLSQHYVLQPRPASNDRPLSF